MDLAVDLNKGTYNVVFKLVDKKETKKIIDCRFKI